MREGMPAFVEGNLEALFSRAPTVPLADDGRWVIVSDLHVGDGGSRDDFLPNAELFMEAFRGYYLRQGFGLVLNGDIEELQRHRLHAIRERWEPLFALFEEFRRRTAMFKIVGNHDAALCADRQCLEGLHQAVSFDHHGERLFIFHGHQATVFFERFNWVAAFLLRYGANALRISNFPVAFESGKKYVTEHRVYGFSSRRKIVSIIGHTHRPLFESMSKLDEIKLLVDQLCHRYPSAPAEERAVIEKAIAALKVQLEALTGGEAVGGIRDSLYSEELLIPSLFNSGCAIGKRGITAIELDRGAISLVHWFHERRAQGGHRAAVDAGVPRQEERLGDSPYFRTVIKHESLSYIFSRIMLLA